MKNINKDYILKKACYASVICLTLVLLIAYGFMASGMTNALSGKILFSDFAETISYCIAKNPYSGESGIRSIYPPFAYLPFYPFALICKGPLQDMLDGNIALNEMYSNGLFVFSYILYFVINLGLILYFVAKLSKLKGKNLAYLLITVSCFGPILYVFLRANVIITACLFTLMFFYFYNSESKWKREIANICLAGAIAVKIYPALICVYFLKDKRFKDLGKTLLYAFLLLFLPFALIDEGFGNIEHIWNNFTVFNSGQGREGDFSNISLHSLLYKFIGGLGGLFGIVSPLLRHGMVVMAIVVLLLSKRTNKIMQCMLVSLGVYALWQGVSYAYTMTYILIPLILYFNNFDEFSNFDKWYYGICYALIGCSVFYVFGYFILQSIALTAIVVKSFIDLIKDISKNKKENIAQEKA